MLIIRKSQIAALAQARIERLTRSMADCIMSSDAAPAQAPGIDQVEALVRQALERARKRKFLTRRSQFSYVVFVYILGENFEADTRYPWIQKTLADESIPTESKMDVLRIHAEEELGERYTRIMGCHARDV